VKQWWLRPGVRVGAAVLLPVVVPAIITLLLWALPGDPTSIICPKQTCTGGAALAAKWNLDQGPIHFYVEWLKSAMSGDFGATWRWQAGTNIAELMVESTPNTLLLLAFSLISVATGTVLGASQKLPQKLLAVLQVVGLVPGIVLALVGAAWVELHYGASSFMGPALWARLFVGAAVIGLADGALSSTITGTTSLFRSEGRQRYVGIAILRGERVLANTLPNVMPALAGQLRARTLHLLSGAVIVEAIVGIDGLGDLLLRGALNQDFGLVLASATAFAVFSSVLLLTQAGVEIGTAVIVRRSPAGVVEAS
jgi:peptide/nickel transport system permease protein